MKKNRVIFFLSIIAMLLTGCSKYEKDESYAIELYGSYSKCIEATNISYSLSEIYTFNTDDTYNYIYKEVINGNTNNDINTDGEILSIEEISDDITEITLDRKVVELDGQESYEVIYKYKNMIGDLDYTEIPRGKTFDLIILKPYEGLMDSYPNNGFIFDKKGNYHSCLDTTKCNHTEENHDGVYYKYVRKNNLIYFTLPEEKNIDYQILYYITDKGLFFPKLYKEK